MATYGFTPDDHALAVQWIERSSVDREKAGGVMLAAAYLLAVVAGGLLVHLASINNIILLWLNKPTTVLGILFSLGSGIWALRKSNRKTLPVSEELSNRNYSAVQDGSGHWWLLNTQTGQAEPIKIR